MKANDAEFLELSQELLDRGKSIRFRARGISMHPFIKNGSILIVEPLNGASVNIGDVVFYRRAGDLLTAHRLISIYRKGDSTVLITKGDSLRHLDPPISMEQVMGRVIRIEGEKKRLRLNGWPGRFLGFFIALFARGRYPNQGRFVRNLGRLWWLLGGEKTGSQ